MKSDELSRSISKKQTQATQSLQNIIRHRGSLIEQQKKKDAEFVPSSLDETTPATNKLLGMLMNSAKEPKPI